MLEAPESNVFKPGDRIVTIAGQEVAGWTWIGRLVQSHGRAGEPLPVTVERNGSEIKLEVRPR